MTVDLRSSTPAGTYPVPNTKAFRDEMRAELDDLYKLLMAVEHSREAEGTPRDPCYMVGYAQGAVGSLLDKLEGRRESSTASRARHEKWLRQMEGR